MILSNLNYRAFNTANLRWMFTTFHMGHYEPLTWITLAFDYALWGLNPTGFHLTNLVLHTINAVVFYFVALRLLALSWAATANTLPLRIGAAIAALAFAIHPLRVESVAWATERRDVLSALFVLLTLICYLKAAAAKSQDGYRKWMLGAVGCFLLSLLSKAVGITLPVVLVILDVYPLRRLPAGDGKWLGGAATRVWLEKLPFVVLATAAAVLAFLAQYRTGAMELLSKRGALPRIAQAFYALAFYVSKTILPRDLSPLYELPGKFEPGEWIFVVSAAIVLAVSGVLIALRHRWPAGLAVWLSYIALIAPVSGIVQSGPQLVADRYSYLSCLGWAVLLGGAAVAVSHKGALRKFAWVPAGAGAVVLATFAVLTWKQTQLWHDSETLFRSAVNGRPGTVLYFNLGTIYLQNGKLDEAVASFRRSIELNPYYPHPYVNLAIALTAQGKTDEAIATFRDAVRMNKHLASEDNIGAALVQRGLVVHAITYYTEALKDQSYSPAVQNNLGLAYEMQGELDNALAHYQRALELDPHHSVAEFNSGNVHSQLGELKKAEAAYRRAVEEDSHFFQAYRRLGVVLRAQGRDEEALQNYRRALELNPSYAAAHYNLGNAFLSKNDTERAIQHYRAAIARDPSHVRAHAELGRALALRGETKEAVREIEQALEIDDSFATAHFNLAILLDRLGDRKGAIEHLKRVVEIAPGDSQARQQLTVWSGPNEEKQPVVQSKPQKLASGAAAAPSTALAMRSAPD
jgi:protein O-mannosyl-transferase